MFCQGIWVICSTMLAFAPHFMSLLYGAKAYIFYTWLFMLTYCPFHYIIFLLFLPYSGRTLTSLLWRQLNFYLHACFFLNFLNILFWTIVSLQKELIRTVDLGPFKHTVDDGLELRKAAFECVDTLLDSCLDQMNPSSFIVPYLLSGLDGKWTSQSLIISPFFISITSFALWMCYRRDGWWLGLKSAIFLSFADHYDVKMPCHLILSKLADKCPSAVLAGISTH